MNIRTDTKSMNIRTDTNQNLITYRLIHRFVSTHAPIHMLIDRLYIHVLQRVLQCDMLIDRLHRSHAPIHMLTHTLIDRLHTTMQPSLLSLSC